MINTGSEKVRPLIVPMARLFQKGLMSPIKKGINPNRVEAIVRKMGMILAL